MNTIEKMKKGIQESMDVKAKILQDEAFLSTMEKALDKCVEAFKNNGRVYFCGNGGSAADAQHLSAELAGRFYINRPALFSEALHVNTSYLTAVANDFSYNEIYSRLVEAKVQKGDVLFCISTSGNSENIYLAAKKANEQGATTIGFTGKGGGKIKEEVTLCLDIPSQDTARIQEAHIVVGHLICELIESRLFQ